MSSSLRSRTVRGLVSVAVASLIIRGGGLISQLVAGSFVDPDEFGLFAIALGITTFGLAASSSLRPLLIERLAAEDQGAVQIWRVGFLAVGGLSVVAFAAADLLASAIGEPESAGVIRIALVAVPLRLAAGYGMAKIAAGLEFKRTSQILARSAISRHLLVIVMAILGAGVYALVVPLIVESLALLALTVRSAGPPPSIIGPFRKALSDDKGTLGWVAFTAATLAIAINGDYLTLSFFVPVAQVGLYYFAFQLTAAITQPFTMAASNVLVPSFARAPTPAAAGSAYLDAIRVQLAGAGLAFGLMALGGGAAMHVIWGGTWDDSAVVLVAIALGTPFRMLNPLVLSLFQSQGNFRESSLFTFASAVLLIAAVCLGGTVGGINEVAVLSGLSFVLVGMLGAALAGRGVGVSSTRTGLSVAKGLLPSIAGALVAFGALPGALTSVGVSLARMAIFLAIWMFGSAVLLHKDFRSLVSLVRS